MNTTSQKPRGLDYKGSPVRDQAKATWNRLSPSNKMSFESKALRLARWKAETGQWDQITEYEDSLLAKHDKNSHREHLMRENISTTIREENLEYLRREKAEKEVEGCTFEPDTRKSRKAMLNGESGETRDLYHFLSDQQRFLEYKSMKQLKTKKETIDKELLEMKPKPQVDGLSKQIVETMTERKHVPIHERLYAKGKEKLRNQAAAQTQKIPDLARSPTRLHDTSEFGREYVDGLHNLHKTRQIELEKAAYMQNVNVDKMANSKHKNKESEEYRIEGFKKEFRRVLMDLKNQEMGNRGRDLYQEIDPAEHALQFGLVAHIMHQMEFLRPKLSVEQENQMSDLYTLFKCTKDQSILAENLQNILMVISGQRNPDIEVPAEEGSYEGGERAHKPIWHECGAYDQDSGLFYLREGEHVPVQAHFKMLRLNRLHQRATKSSYQHKRAEKETTFQPKISKTTKELAAKQRFGRAYRHGSPEPRVNIVDHLTDPSRLSKKEARLQQVRAAQEAKLAKELTLQPRVLNKSRRLAQRRGTTTGDVNSDLYLMAPGPGEKRDKHTIDYEYEKAAEECSFTPNINKRPAQQQEVNHLEHNAMMKHVNKMNKAREEQEFKKLMQGRNPYSATKGMKEARKVAPAANAMYGGNKQFRTNDAAKVRSTQQPLPSRHVVAAKRLAEPINFRPREVYPVDDEQLDEFEAAHPDHAAQLINEKDDKDLVDQQLNDMGEQIDERDPKLYVEVNIAKNCIEKIVVYEGDTAESLAENFCKKHNLDDSMKEKLKIRLEHQINSVLHKIIEDEDADDNDDSSAGVIVQ